MRNWTAAELRRFLESVESDRLYAAWLVAASTGMRRGELLGLRWSDLEFDATILKHENHWWLVATRGVPPSSQSALCVWWAKDLAGPWCPHPMNPVKTDPRSSRLAGTPFVHAGSFIDLPRTAPKAMAAR
jgi:integrase